MYGFSSSLSNNIELPSLYMLNMQNVKRMRIAHVGTLFNRREIIINTPCFLSILDMGIGLAAFLA